MLGRSVRRSLHVMVDGKLTGRDALVSVHDEALLRGTGAFEVIGVLGGAPVGVREHLARLQLSLRHVGITLPYGPEAILDYVRSIVTCVVESSRHS